MQASPAPAILEPDAAGIRRAATALRQGRLVAFPTETVYGLGADARSDRAVAAVFAAKGRPRFNPLIVHLADAEAARRIVRFTPLAERLAARFWPGPLTLVLPRRDESGVSLLAGAGLPSLAVRVPRHAVAQALLAVFGGPVVAPSANRSGRISATTAAHVARGLGGRVAVILDGGRCAIGIESTVIDLTGPRPALLRPGGLTQEEIAAALGRPILESDDDDGSAPRSPGRLASHYAPERPLRLEAKEVRPGEALLAFGPGAPQATLVENLSPSGDLEEAAANLFAMLHRLDRPEVGAIAVMPIPERGLGRAINDRLRRAAAPRPAAPA